MTEAMDWARFNLQTLTTDMDYRLKIASTRAQLAEKMVDIASKRVDLAAKIEEQRRMADAYQDFVTARTKALRELRKAERRSELVHQRLQEFQGLFTATTPTAIRRGWIGYKYFLLKLPISVGLSLDPSPLLEDLRKKNQPLTPEARQLIAPVIEAMVTTTEKEAEKAQLKLKEIQDRADKIRTANWKTVKLDPNII